MSDEPDPSPSQSAADSGAGAGVLMGRIAHDFNNVLAAVRGSAEILALDLEPGSPCQVDVAQILRATERAEALTTEMLGFSRRYPLRRERIELNAFFRQAGRPMQAALGDGVALELRPAPGESWVDADRDRLLQVFTHLLNNAREALPRGGRVLLELEESVVPPTGRSAGRSLAPGVYVVTKVTDNGVGMDAATAAHAFDPFFTTKGTGAGTGVGLPIAYGIVRSSGGDISVRSEPGAGSTIEVWLPRADGAGRPPGR